MTGLIRPDTIAIGPDGSLYIAGDELPIVYRIAPSRGSFRGVQIFAGMGFGNGVSGDGSLATATKLYSPSGLAVGPDGSVYIVEDGRVRRVGPDGIITTVAGNGSFGFGGDGGQATGASLGYPTGVAVGPDGSIYIADRVNQRIRRVGPDGIITTIAGNGSFGSSGDGGLATGASLGYPSAVAVGPDGSIYIADTDNYRIRQLSPDGIITTVVGNGTFGFVGEDGAATQANIVPQGIAVGPDENLYVADSIRRRVLRVSPSLPGFSATDFAITSEDGSELYRFTSAGRHLDTRDALTGAIIYTFGYDAAGRLASVTDANNNVTSIDHDAAGNPTAIVGAFGQRTTLGVNADGYLTSVTNPGNETTALGYGTGGLLTSFTDPKGNRSAMTYDGLGRLTRDEDQLSGFTQLTRQELGGGNYQVTTADAMGGTQVARVEFLPDGSRRRTSMDGRGFATVTLIGTDGRSARPRPTAPSPPRPTAPTRATGCSPRSSPNRPSPRRAG